MRICAVQSKEMATIVHVRKHLTTYCHSLQVFRREMRGCVSSYRNSYVFFFCCLQALILMEWWESQ
jgi:hypothetical protein